MDNTIYFTNLENTIHPAFIVENGIITKANRSAQNRLITIGTHIDDLICVGKEEYARFQNGQLSLTIEVCGAHIDAWVVPVENFEVFYLESDYEAPELRAFALAAQYLRDPLSTALNATYELLPVDSLKRSVHIKEQLAYINKSLHQLLKIVENMSDVAGFDDVRSGKKKTHNISGMLRDLAEKTTHFTESKNINVHYTGPKTPTFAIVDPEKLERAILNLLSNAIKHTPDNNDIIISLNRKGNKLYISVQDGAGDDAVLEKDLFSQYLREPSIDNTNNGVGLGLALVRKTAALHGGTVLAEKTEKGVYFTISILAESTTRQTVRSPMPVRGDYTGGFNRMLVEFSDILPNDQYK